MRGAPDDVLRRILLTLCSHIGRHTNSFLQDMLKGRPSELPYMNGLVAAKGREAGIPTPLNDEITRLVELIERGEMSFGPEHLPLLESLAGSVGRVERSETGRAFATAATERARP